MSAPVSPVGSHVLRARTAVALVFGLNGFAFASWIARIPESRTALDLTPGALGTLLLAIAVGSVLALPAAGPVVHRIGAARVVAGGALLDGLGLVVAGVGVAAGEVLLTALGLFLLGVGSGSWDVAMNVEGAVVERWLARSIMPRFHAAFSLGTVAGAGVGAALSALGVPVVGHLVAAGLVVAASTLAVVRAFLQPEAETDPGVPTTRRNPMRAWREPRTLVIGVMVLAMAFTEGAANDWLAVALVDGHGATPAAGAVGFAVFVAAMTAGRTVGSTLLDRYGRLLVLRASMLMAGVGVLVVVLSEWLPLVVLGVVVWGLGASLGFPVGMSAAADDPVHAAARVSVVSSIGYTAFLAGPPLIGFLGDSVGTLRALLVVAVLLIPSLLAVGAARPLPGGRRAGPGRGLGSRPVETGTKPLSSLTTLRVGGAPRDLVEAADADELVAAVTRADDAGEPVLLVAGGSNLLVADDGFDGTVVRVVSRGITVESDDLCGGVTVRVAAGHPWDDLVTLAVVEGWTGVEALSGIPGSTGATPVQNVGAYGQDVSQTCASVRTWDRTERRVRTFAASECGFGYRTSRFKADRDRFVVLDVAFALRRGDMGAAVRYAELARALDVGTGERAPLADVREAVLALRRGKGMVLDDDDHDTWSAGSFFTNPIVRDASALPQGAPAWPTDGGTKSSAAWLIEHAGFRRGHGMPGPAALSTKHALAVTNRGSACAEDLLALARQVRDGVAGATGVVLENEPVLVGCVL